MNKTKQFCLGLGFSLCAVSAAMAQVTVGVSATVDYINDPMGVLANVQMGDVISGSYSYDPTTADMDPVSPSYGVYQHGPGAGSINLVLGSYMFDSDSAAPMPLEIYITDHMPDEYTPGTEGYAISTPYVLPTNGLTVHYVAIDLQTWDSNSLPDDQLTATPPDLNSFNGGKMVMIAGEMNGHYFNLNAQLNVLGDPPPPPQLENVPLTAVVTGTYDPGNVLTDIQIGDLISGSYDFDPATVDSDATPMYGFYRHPNGVGGFNITLGSHSFFPRADGSSIHEIMVSDDASWENFQVVTHSMASNSDLEVHYVNIDMAGDGNGNALANDQLPIGAPDINPFNMHKQVSISGTRWGHPFNITAELTGLGDSLPPPQPEPGLNQSNGFIVTARVEQGTVIPPELLGRVAVGDKIITHVTIDPNTLDEDISDLGGLYKHSGLAAMMKLEFPDGTTFETSTVQGPESYVSIDPMSGEIYDTYADSLSSSDPMLTMNWAVVNLSNATLTLLADDSLNPEIVFSPNWDNRMLHMGGDFWNLIATIESIVPMIQQVVEVVPGDAKLHAAQRFDMAVNLSNYAAVTTVNGTLNGMPLDAYLMGCMVDMPVATDQSLLCQDMHMNLAPGQNVLELQLMLDDASVVNKTVTWDR